MTDTSDGNFSISTDGSLDLADSWSGDVRRVRPRTRGEDAELLFTLLANLGDGEMKGYRSVKAKEQRLIVGWAKDNRDERIEDAATLLESRGLVHLERASCPPLIVLSLKGRAEARRRGFLLAGAPVEDARWLLEQLVARNLETPDERQLIKLTSWPWPRITDALTILDQHDLVDFLGDDDSPSNFCSRDQILVWEEGITAIRGGYDWDAVTRPWSAKRPAGRGTVSRGQLLEDFRMWPSRATR